LLLRPATLLDIDPMHVIRMAVKENILSDPSLITPQDYAAYLENRGAGWVVEIENQIVGFAIVDLREHNVWALFVHPDAEKKGVGRQLHDEMIRWYFSQTTETLWLGTEPNSRAEGFYRKAGWKDVGKHGSTEIKFEYYAPLDMRT
jgi:GNAT superfamily N-acetyltransferase